MRDAELIALLTHTSGAATRTATATSVTSAGATAAATTTTTLKRERSNSGSGSARTPSPTRSRHATTTTTTTRARSRDDKGNHGSTKTRGSGSTSTPCARRVSVNWCTVAALLYGTTRQRLYTPARVRAMYTRLLRSDAYAGDEAALRRDTLAQAAAMRPSRCSNDNNTDDADESDDDDYTLPRPLTSMHAELSFMANSAAAAAVSSPTRTHTHGSKKDDDDDNDGEQQKKTTKTTTTAGHGNNDTAHVTSEHHHHHNNNSNSNNNKDDEDADEDEVARWLRRLLPDVRAHARLLWYEVALRHEVLSALLQQFFCVDGAEVFFAPVPANTIMEYNGVRLATYHSVVRVPMSLMAIKKCISDSRRDYHALTRAAALTTQQRGQRRGDHDNNEDDDTTSDSMSSDVAYNNNTTTAVSLCRSSHMDRIVTLAELHRDVWLIAANCVMFNAPETNYPYTARRFARACTRLLIDYADKQLGDTAPLVRA